jgi:hypothetical protein
MARPSGGDLGFLWSCGISLSVQVAALAVLGVAGDLFRRTWCRALDSIRQVLRQGPDHGNFDLVPCRFFGRLFLARPSCVARKKVRADETLVVLRLTPRDGLRKTDDHSKPTRKRPQNYPLTLIRRPFSPSRSKAMSTSHRSRGNFSPHSISRMLLSERRSSNPSVSNSRGVSMRYRSMW